ncbi:unnamed protein product, partial [Bubo scandiacus]
MSMSDRREEEAPDSMEQVCVLCGQAAVDLVLWGQKIEQEELYAHFFCLVSAPGLLQLADRHSQPRSPHQLLLSSLLQIFASKLLYWQDEESGQQRFIPEDIPCQCFICGESGAAITCCREGCGRSFHLPCAAEGECVTQYFLPHRSFCREHHPEQEVEAVPEKDTACIICLEPVEDRKSYYTMVCPACKDAWFHRGCIQGQARYAGTVSFSCPLCRDKYEFLHDMLAMGIRIPVRLPSQDNGPPDGALMERHSRCNACECLCPGGREQAEERGPWELLLCSSCAAEGSHRRCSNLGTSRTSWECESCAGQGTGTLPPAPQRCSFPPAFALSPAVCVLCGQAAVDLVLWGQKIEQEELYAHFFCLIFASKLLYWQDEESGQQRFIPEDIPCVLERVVDKQCFVCGESGAAITCCREGCDRSFHLPCAAEGECVTQYFLPHRSFCREHHPEQEVEAVPEKDTACIICLEPVEDRKSYYTMVCPACKDAWFHRGCIQGQARYAGTVSFSCPLCRDKYEFLHDMLAMGIRIPVRLPSQDNGPPDGALMERHSRCNACECLCPGGREQAEERGPWELLLCSSCAAEGSHRRCSNLETSRTSWECESCAGQGTALLTSPIPSLFPQVLLQGAPPRAGGGGGSREGHCLHHLPGACGGQKVLLHHGVPGLQRRLVPQGLHPGRSRSLTPRTRQALGSTRASLLLLLFPLQGQARYAGTVSFSCPLCRDKYEFLHDMLAMGIRIPVRLPSQDNGPPDGALMERHSRCNACECLCPGGREQAEERGPWELLLCSSCAAEGSHRRCSNLGTSRTSWECESCAGQGTGLGAPLWPLHSGLCAPRRHRGRPTTPQRVRAAAAPAHLGPSTCDTAPGCNVGPRRPTAGPGGTGRGAARQHQLEVLKSVKNHQVLQE